MFLFYIYLYFNYLYLLFPFNFCATKIQYFFVFFVLLHIQGSCAGCPVVFFFLGLVFAII